MTFTIKMRGAPGFKVHEYLCPVHGRFEITVVDAPDKMACPGPGCGTSSPHAISAPKPKNLSILPTAVVRGGDTERRPGMLDTRPLAEGMPMREWKAGQKKITEERRHHQLIKKGLKTKRIQVG